MIFLTSGAYDRMLGFDMQLIIQLVIQLINTGVLCFFLAKILYKPVREYLANRTERIAKSLKEADDALVNAQRTKEWYEEKLKAIDYERDEILDLARQRGLDMENKIISDAQQEANIIRERALTEIKREEDNSLDEMKRQIIDISTLVAQKYIEEKIDGETQNRLLDEVIADLGDATWLN